MKEIYQGSWPINQLFILLSSISILLSFSNITPMFGSLSLDVKKELVQKVNSLSQNIKV